MVSWDGGDIMANIYLLDASLRDGGYVNQWKFANKDSHDIIKLLSESNVDFIECGILGVASDAEGTKQYVVLQMVLH